MISVELVQNVAHATLELGDRKNLVIDYRLGTVKVKTRSDQACSWLPSVFSGKKRKTDSSFFLFTTTKVKAHQSVDSASPLV